VQRAKWFGLFTSSFLRNLSILRINFLDGYKSYVFRQLRLPHWVRVRPLLPVHLLRLLRSLTSPNNQPSMEFGPGWNTSCTFCIPCFGRRSLDDVRPAADSCACRSTIDGLSGGTCGDHQTTDGPTIGAQTIHGTCASRASVPK